VFEGTVNDDMQSFINQYEDEHIKYLGSKPQSSLNWYYSQADVFSLLSLEEGLAMVQAQAMACGLPIICTTNTGGEDLIQEGRSGFVIPIRDINALKDKILFFFENRLACKEMGIAAKQRVQDTFSWNNYGENIINEYKRVLLLNE
jgi:glycosyltransferase involved in cell wall biosynthesis